MKKYLSVFSLVARESLFRISALWVASAVIQTVLFYFAVLSEDMKKTQLLYRAFEYKQWISGAFALTLLLTGILLMKTGMEFRTKTGYTLRRLRISERSIFLLQSTYNSLMLFLLLLFEFVFMFALMNFGKGFIDEKFITNQTVYTGFYISDVLHNVFAGRDIVMVLRNILMMLSLGFNLSAFSMAWRRGKKYIFGVLLLVIICFLFFAINPGMNYDKTTDITYIAISVLMLVSAVVINLRRSEDYDA